MNRHGFGKLALPLLPLVLLAACAQPKWIAGAPPPPPLPERVYEQAARKGETVYRVDPQQSRVFVRTGRDGSMKSAGHDHVITSADIEGLVLLSVDPEESRADLRLPLQLLIVDDPAYRARFGLEPDIPQSAIDGTTRNMQEKVLESNLFPWAVVSVRALSIPEGQAELGVRVTLHGTTFDYRVPAALTVDSGKLGVSGSMTVHHADLGLTPFSAAGGLLRVADNIEVVFDVVAIRGLDVSRNRAPD
ncbi:MAG: YceI family protein [Gammaproteobacteria bacterium]|nr:YceI family protein [Gammaproteobacteria bacterium]MDH3372635.1 YceI family protein [Gammaproteobacteria bacterium]MDH3552420.1 YceI family protein [Gammaproteobacteria bacterium]